MTLSKFLVLNFSKNSLSELKKVVKNKIHFHFRSTKKCTSIFIGTIPYCYRGRTFKEESTFHLN